MYRNNSVEVKLIGMFKEKFVMKDTDYIELGYNFDVLLFQDFMNGEISGCRLGDRVYFKSCSDIEFYLPAYQICNLDEYTEQEIQDIKYSSLSKEEQRFLNSLEEKEIITFWARIPIDFGYNEFALSNLSAWDFERYGDCFTERELNTLLDELVYV